MYLPYPGNPTDAFGLRFGWCMARRPSFRFPRGGAGLDIPLAACRGVEEKGVKGIYAPIVCFHSMKKMQAFKSLVLYVLNPFISHFYYQKEEMYAYISHF